VLAVTKGEKASGLECDVIFFALTSGVSCFGFSEKLVTSSEWERSLVPRQKNPWMRELVTFQPLGKCMQALA